MGATTLETWTKDTDRAWLPATGASDVMLESDDHDPPAERLNVLVQVAMQLTAERDLDRLLERIVAAATRVVDAERGSIFLIDWDSLLVTTRVAQAVHTIRMPIGTGIAGYVAQTGETIRVNDAYECPHFSSDVDRRNGFRTKAVLCMPMVSALGQRIGVIQVLNKHDATEEFSAEDEELLGAFASQAAIAIDNAQRLEMMERLIESVIRTMASTIDHRDYITGGHSARVTDYTMRIVEGLGITEPRVVRTIRCAATLHDYGKIGVSESVLCKPGELTEEEFREMRLHVVFTREILSKLDLPPELSDVPRIASEHHERLDGTGYPDRVTGDRLTLGGRLIAVADVFDALSSQRQYREPMTPTALLHVLRSEANSQLDGGAVRALLGALPQIMSDWGPEGDGHFSRKYASEMCRVVNGV